MRIVPGDTFEVVFRNGATSTRGSVFVVADAPGRPTVGGVPPGALTADERLALEEAIAGNLVGVDNLLCMTVSATTALVERARGGGSAEDDEP